MSPAAIHAERLRVLVAGGNAPEPPQELHRTTARSGAEYSVTASGAYFAIAASRSSSARASK
jgi:hypothetical protein